MKVRSEKNASETPDDYLASLSRQANRSGSHLAAKGNLDLLRSRSTTKFVIGLLAACAVTALAEPPTAMPTVPSASPKNSATQNAHGDYLEIAGSKLYYEQGGSGPALVLLHDGLIHAVTWDGVWDPLCAKFHAIRYDRRGYGRSDAPKAAFSSTDDLYKLLTHLKVEHAIVVGSSSGGALAIDFALEHPQMVDGLFLIGPVLHGMRDTAYFLERGNRNNEPMQRNDLKAAVENWSKDRFLIAGNHEQARKKLYDELIGSPKNLNYNNRLEIKLSPPASKRLSEIKTPTFLLTGEADIADVHSYVGAINLGIRESVRSVVKDAGHLVQLEKPEELLGKLTPFAQRCARPQAKLSPELLAAYAGQYKVGETVLTLQVEGSHLLGQVSSEGEFFFFPQSETRFYSRLLETEVEFEKDTSGKVIDLIVHQAGTATKWQRLS